MGQYYEQADNLSLIQGEDFYYDLYRFDNAQVVSIHTLVSPTGSFKLSFQGVETVPIDIAAASADVAAALQSVRTIGYGNVSVTGSAGGPWTVTWLKSLSRTVQPLMGVTWTFDDPATSVSVGPLPHDVTGYTAICKLRDTPGGGSPYASLTQTVSADGQVILTDAANGHVRIWIKSAKTTAFSFTTAQMDLQLISAVPIVEAWLKATVRLQTSVIP